MENQSAFDFALILNKAIRIITNPVAFYRSMPTSGGFVEPMVFIAILLAIGAVVMIVLDFVGAGTGGIMVPGIATVIIIPVVGITFSFVGAAIMYVTWKLMGSKESYEAAYRCTAYTIAIFPIVTVLHHIPYIGSIISSIWYMYLAVTASIEVHKLRTNVAYGVFGTLALLGLIVTLSGEYATRQFIARMEQLSHDQTTANKMSPQDPNKAVEGILKELQQPQQEQDSNK